MRQTLGQTFVVENVVGAGGSIAVGRAVRAAPDGYTISYGHLGTHVFNGAIYPLQYDLLADLEPLALLPSNHGHRQQERAAGQDLQELIAWSRANQTATGDRRCRPGSHVAGVFPNVTGCASVRALPRNRSGLNDLVGGQIDIIVDQASIPCSRSRGTSRLCRVRQQAARPPDIPTADEAGAGFHMTVECMWCPRHAQGRDRKAQRRGGGDGRSGREAALNDLGLTSRRASSRRRRLARGTRLKPRNGCRSSRRRTSSRSEPRGAMP
jgi:tripartite-type tricarboxylate transporter receptor subunit TctC